MRKLVIHLVVGIWVLGLGPHTLLAGDASLQEALKLDRQGFLEESIPEWKKFLQTRPEKKLDIYAQIKIIIAYSRTGNVGEALQSAKALAASYPDHYDVQFNLGNMLSATHQYAEAAEAYRKATLMRPDEGLAFVGYGICLFGDQKLVEAVKVLREVKELFKSQKNISWYQHVRIMIGQIKGFEMYPPDFSTLWRTNNLTKVRETYESSVFTDFEKQLNL
ncbi:MAG: tetratricopeptide repeat protein [Nitrospinota bacterium]|nr:tetratricopeptide repeat protein [Nitrospinota bacterium]